MKSPYKPSVDPRNDRILPVEEKRLIELGYEFIGWNPEPNKIGKFRDCLNMAHNYYSSFPNVWQTVEHTHDGTDITKSCTKCKIYWKVDLGLKNGDDN